MVLGFIADLATCFTTAGHSITNACGDGERTGRSAVGAFFHDKTFLHI